MRFPGRLRPTRRDHGLWALRRAPRGEDGFLLLESIVAISLITIVMGALASFTLNAVSGSNELRARQAATQLATSAMATIGTVPATDLITGRDSASVAAQYSSASSTVAPWLATMKQVSDGFAAAGAGATATVPTRAVSQTLNSITYSVASYLGSCALRSASSTDCVVGGTGVTHLRAVVAVTWSGRGCRSTSCTYVTATLINADADPVFNTNRAQPPTRPVVTNPGSQTSTVGATVGLQLAIEPGTGLAPLAWQLTTGTLPTGLTMSADGLISGSPTVRAAATSLTVTVSDAFGRTATATFTWTIVAPPTITTPAAQSTAKGQAVSLAVSATCPNGPCTYVLAGAPAGLTIDAATGVITGRPTTPGTSTAVTVTVTSADGVSATTAAFTWVVLQPATIASPGTLSTTVGAVVAVPLAYTCPGTPCTLTLTGNPPGVGLATSAVTTNNTATTLTVTAASGTVYLSGTVQATAVSTGTSQAYAPTVKVTDTYANVVTSTPGAWTVFIKPTVAAVGSRNATVGASKNVSLAYTCPSVPCTITLTNPVPGLGLSTVSGQTATNTTTSVTVSATSGTVYINGTTTAAAVPSGTTKAYALTVTITDPSAVSASTSGTWTATNAPKLTNPGSQAIEPNQTLGLQLAAECPNGGCTWYAEVQIVGDSTWYPVPITAAGKINYPNAPAGAYTARVTVTDSDGITDTTTFPLTVQTFTIAIPNQTTSRPLTGTRVVTLDVSALVRPLADGYTFTMTGAPSWLSISADGILTATVTPLSLTDTAITVRVTSTASSTSTEATTFSWTIR